MQGLKTKLCKDKGRWVEELYEVLLAYQTTPRVSTNKSPFNLTFGTEAMILVKIGILTMRIEHYEELSNSDSSRANLDLL